MRTRTKHAPDGLRLPDEAVEAFAAGLALYDQGYGGAGLVPATIREARDAVRTGRVSTDKARRMAAWFARHGAAVAESTARRRDRSSPAAVAWLLWGGDVGRAWAERHRDAKPDNAEVRPNGDVEKGFTDWLNRHKYGKAKALAGAHWRYEAHLFPDGQVVRSGHPFVRLDAVRAQARRAILDATRARYTDGPRRGEFVATGGVYQLFERVGTGPETLVESMALVTRDEGDRTVRAFVPDDRGELLRAGREAASRQRETRGAAPRMPKAGSSMQPPRTPVVGPPLVRVEGHRSEALERRIASLVRGYRAAVLDAIRDWRVPVAEARNPESVRRHAPTVLPDPSAHDASLDPEEDRARRLAALEVGAWLREGGAVAELREIAARGESVFRDNPARRGRRGARQRCGNSHSAKRGGRR